MSEADKVYKTARSDCEVCQGRGYVQLPRFPRIRFTPAEFGGLAPTSLSYSNYPCPECGEMVPVERVHILTECAAFDPRYNNEPGFRQHVLAGAAHRLIDALIKSEHITIQNVRETPEDLAMSRRRLTATLGVVSSVVVATAEQRALAAGRALAHEVIAEAAHRISNWGSERQHAHISKETALRLMREALHEIEQAGLSRMPGNGDRAREG